MTSTFIRAFCCCFLLSTLFTAGLSYSSDASLFLTPKSLIFADSSRSQSVHIVNRGQRTGVFSIHWIDHTMTDDGRLFTWKDPEKSPWSLQPFIRYSPRRVTLRPGETQRVRVSLKRSHAEAALGEYFSHLKVITINKNLEDTKKNKSSGPNKQGEASINIKTRSGISIPVIWRTTQENPAADLKFEAIDSHNIRLLITRYGQVSTRGFLHFTHSFNGKHTKLKQIHPVVIYPNLAERIVSLKMNEPLPTEGTLDIYYSEGRENTEQLIGQTQVKL